MWAKSSGLCPWFRELSPVSMCSWGCVLLHLVWQEREGRERILNSFCSVISKSWKQKHRKDPRAILCASVFIWESQNDMISFGVRCVKINAVVSFLCSVSLATKRWRRGDELTWSWCTWWQPWCPRTRRAWPTLRGGSNGRRSESRERKE